MKTNTVGPLDITVWALDHGWNLHGNTLQKPGLTGRTLRLVCTARKLRMEVLSKAQPSRWLLLVAGFYKDISLNPDGTIGGLK